MQWQLVSGNWCLYLKGPGAYEAVGYYPTKIFGSGQLSKSAEVVEYGGELTRDSAEHPWPQMGSSIFPSYGFGQSAFQRTIYYTACDEPGGVGVWTNLQKLVIGSNKCWDMNITQAAQGGSWGTYFFFGGPGGPTCNYKLQPILNTRKLITSRFDLLQTLGLVLDLMDIFNGVFDVLFTIAAVQFLVVHGI